MSRFPLPVLALGLTLSASFGQNPSAPSPGPLGGLDAAKLPDLSVTQTPPADAAAASGPAADAASSAPAAGAPVKSTGPSFMGMELPFLDPGSEVLSWNGNTWNVVNNRMFGARFEKYLSSPAASSKEDDAYRKTLREILDALSPHQARKGNLSKAVGLLPIAAAYYHDARLCESLSNTIYGIWLARRNVNALKNANKVLEKEAKNQLWNAKISSEANPLDERSKLVGRTQKDNRNSNEQTNSVSNSVEGDETGGETPEDRAQSKFSQASYTAYYLKKAAEMESLAAKNKIGMAASDIQQRLEYQGLIMQYFMQRRFEHVVIATRIYRQLFKDGDTSMKFDEESAIYKSFQASSGMNPTVTTFDALANEAIRDVDEGIQAFEHLVAKGELEGATKRLSEAFAVGEYLPGIRTLSMEKKAKVLEFVRHSNQLLSAIDVKNYHLAKELVDKMKVLAKDFDYAKPEGLINATTMTADMLLKRALLAARSGKDDEMQKHLEQAHALYPTNPELKKVSDLILKGSDMQSQALDDLDRLIAEGNYRAIQKDEARFAAAVGLSSDPKRMEDLMSVRDRLKDLEMRIEKAKALVDAGSPEAAWETLHAEADSYNKDPDYAQLYSQLTVKAARFVSMVEEASRHKKNGQLGSSLGWYLKARQMYMKSDLAKEGIEEIVGQLLPDADSSRQDTE